MKALNEMINFAKLYIKSIEEEVNCKGKDEKHLKIKNTGKIDPKKHLLNSIEETSGSNIVHMLGNMFSTRVL